MCAAGGSATGASAVTGGAVRGGSMPSRWAQPLPDDRVLVGGGGPGQFGDQLLAERESGAFGGDPLDAVGDGPAGDEVRSAGVMEGFGWFAA